MTTDKKIQNCQLWEMHLQEFKESGKYQREWCSKNGINYSTFRYWKRKFEKEALQESGPDWIKIKVSDDENVVNLMLEDEADGSELSIVPTVAHAAKSLPAVMIHAGSYTIEVPAGTNLLELSGILSVVKGI